MRLARLLIPLAVMAPLGLPSSAFARVWTVDAVDFSFLPTETSIAVGDSVTWNFKAVGHTSTSIDGQDESWNSAPGGPILPAPPSHTCSPSRAATNTSASPTRNS